MKFLKAVFVGIISFAASFFLSGYSTGWGCSASISIIGIATIYILLGIRDSLRDGPVSSQNQQDTSSQLSDNPPEDSSI